MVQIGVQGCRARTSVFQLVDRVDRRLAAERDQPPVCGPPKRQRRQHRGDSNCRPDLSSHRVPDLSARWYGGGVP